MHAMFVTCPIKLNAYAVVSTFQLCQPYQLPEPRPFEEDIEGQHALFDCLQKKNPKMRGINNNASFIRNKMIDDVGTYVRTVRHT